MNHRKFQQRLDELVAELTHAQAQKLIAALQQRGEGEEVQRLLNRRLEDDPACPHCRSKRVEGWGRERNSLKRSRCLARRISTVRQADKIALIEDGAVTALGTHHDLIRGNAYYERVATLRLIS
jgi:hypothetical protein